MPPPHVSLLLPCHNAAPWLAATLDSALAQTHPRCEVTVVVGRAPQAAAVTPPSKLD